MAQGNELINADEDRAIVSGCRVGNGGLHLGHLYGCFTYLRGGPEANLCFVVSDCLHGQRQLKRDGLEDLIVDVLAVSRCISKEPRIRIVRESTLRPSLGALLSLLLDVATLRDVIGTHPFKEDIRNAAMGMTTGDFVFPLHQATYMLGLQARWASYNDDNNPYIHLARRTARKVNQRFGLHLAEDLELIPRQPSRLNGHDGRRMAKAYNNHLLLNASHRRIQDFATRLWNTCVSTDSTIFEPYSAALSKLGPIDGSPITGDRNLAEILWDGLAVFRNSRREILDSFTGIEDRLAKDEAWAIHVIALALAAGGV